MLLLINDSHNKEAKDTDKYLIRNHSDELMYVVEDRFCLITKKVKNCVVERKCWVLEVIVVLV